jgi:hypothetical protein
VYATSSFLPGSASPGLTPSYVHRTQPLTYTGSPGLYVKRSSVTYHRAESRRIAF